MKYDDKYDVKYDVHNDVECVLCMMLSIFFSLEHLFSYAMGVCEENGYKVRQLRSTFLFFSFIKAVTDLNEFVIAKSCELIQTQTYKKTEIPIFPFLIISKRMCTHPITVMVTIIRQY